MRLAKVLKLTCRSFSCDWFFFSHCGPLFLCRMAYSCPGQVRTLPRPLPQGSPCLAHCPGKSIAIETRI